MNNDSKTEADMNQYMINGNSLNSIDNKKIYDQKINLVNENELSFVRMNHFQNNTNMDRKNDFLNNKYNNNNGSYNNNFKNGVTNNKDNYNVEDNYNYINNENNNYNNSEQLNNNKIED